MKDSFVKTMENQCGLVPGDRVLAAVSGGVDSIALLSLLVSSGFQVVVGHLDHGLRNASVAEMEFVRDAASRLGLPFFTERVDTQLFAKKKRFSIEEAARELRYRFLFRIAAETGCMAVAVGHQADDQAETVLLHLLRGTGLNGMAGMRFRKLTRWNPTIFLVRPLLDMTKAELRDYCINLQLETIVDESNKDVGFLRNRIRHRLLPAMREINPQINAGLRRLADSILGDLEVLENMVEKAWDELKVVSGNGYVDFPLQKFRNLPRGLQRRLIRKAMGNLIPGLKNIGYDLVETAINAVNSPTASESVQLAQGIELKVSGDKFTVGFWDLEVDLSGFPQVLSDEVLQIYTPGKYSLGNNWEVVLSILEDVSDVEIKHNPDLFTAYLDLKEGTSKCVVRRRRKGDRISPLGMGGQSIKVSDLMINEKIPRPARDNWPLVEQNGEIIWVPGCRVSDHTRIKPETSRVVKIEVRRSV